MYQGNIATYIKQLQSRIPFIVMCVFFLHTCTCIISPAAKMPNAKENLPRAQPQNVISFQNLGGTCACIRGKSYHDQGWVKTRKKRNLYFVSRFVI